MKLLVQFMKLLMTQFMKLLVQFMKLATIKLFLLQFNGTWGLPSFVCDFYIAMDVTCSTSSIFNLVAISIDR
jgi:hypothetical protein